MEYQYFLILKKTIYSRQHNVQKKYMKGGIEKQKDELHEFKGTIKIMKG